MVAAMEGGMVAKVTVPLMKIQGLKFGGEFGELK